MNPKLAPLLNQGPDRLLSPKQAAEYLGVAVETLATWRYKGTYQIPYTPVGRLIRYKLSDLQEWVESRTVHPIALNG